MLPVFWGNQNWEEVNGLLVPRGNLSEDDPNYIRYPNCGFASSHELALDSHPQAELRRRLQTQIIESCLATSGQVEPAQVPACILTHGGIASGKTAAIEAFRSDEDRKKNYLHIDFDLVKRQIPEFSYMFEKGIREAAEFTQEESSKLAGRVFQKAIKKRLNVIYEGSLSKIEVISQRIRDMRKKGYEITIVSTHVTLEKGRQRALARFKGGGRYVPEEAVEETYRLCPATLVKLKDLVDAVLLVNNELDGQSARVILAHFPGKTTTVHSRSLYADYIKTVGEAGRLV